MTNFNWIIILISILCILTIAVSDNNVNLLPKSIHELKQYYDVIKNLEKRGILNNEIAANEKQLYIEHASKLVGSKELLTEEEFITWKQRELIVSFSNIIAILAGITVIIALTVLIGIYILPILVHIPAIYWEIFFYIISISLMILNHNSWLIFFGCLTFLATLSFTIKLHFSRDRHAVLKACWICFFVWTIVAIYQQHREAGYLAVMALEASLGFIIFVGELIIVIGFHNEKVIPSATIASFILILIGSILHIQQRSNILTIPFTRPLLFLGTFVYFIGLLILSSSLYTKQNAGKLAALLLQIIAFCSGLATMFFGPMLEIPFIQAIGGTMFVIWLLEKYVEIAPWKNTIAVASSLLDIEIANDETDREHLITTSPILKSNENKNIEDILGAYQKIKKGMFNSQWLLNSQFASFLQQYKPDSAKVLCIASNKHFSVCDGRKNDIDRHIKLKRYNNNIKSFGIDRQLITSTMKSNTKVEETAAAEGTFVYHGVKHSHSHSFQQYFMFCNFVKIKTECYRYEKVENPHKC
ncbi:unnamed protein product [Rotaria sp. Silwood1]|nr:unnamed protein product [Rotaria sp. Silwood1]CAF3412866.1 unnamed protein product [Rotaria sp. Silwood1]CAF4632288.1 unnamed protein product [Rotaria sp. Silwood1]CAF4844763.1 unnamed protein product [Rotaria sp. Silwood1]